jgi:8-oxo-dGTP diphosphatase
MIEKPANDNRLYPVLPMVGVGVVVINEGRLLMVRRSREPGKGQWSVPGGRLELGETLRDGARRELAEECSIDAEIERFLDATDAIIRDADGRVRYHYVLVDVVGRYRGGEPKAESDAAECRWVGLKEVPALDMPESLRAVLERNGIINKRRQGGPDWRTR